MLLHTLINTYIWLIKHILKTNQQPKIVFRSVSLRRDYLSLLKETPNKTQANEPIDTLKPK